MSRLSTLFVSWLLCTGLGLAARAGKLAVKVTVREPAGVARRAEPASGGVPFKKGQVKSVAELALFDAAGRPVPAQFSKLAPYEDGSVQWALVDFMADVPANGKAEFIVKKGNAAMPARPISIKEAGETVTVDTGAARFTVNRARFSLLESVALEGEKVGGSGSLEIADASGKVFEAGKPFRVSWEYKGPVRATLRVDGPYLDEAGEEFVRYTTRLTFWAGLSAVRVEHSARNSNPAEGDDARIKWAALSLGFGARGGVVSKAGKSVAHEDGRVGLLIVRRHTGGCFPSATARRDRAPDVTEFGRGKVTVWVIPRGSGGKRVYGYGDGYFALADCAHKDTELWLDFYPGKRDPAANEARDKALRSKLHALADGAWVSETAAMGYGRFGTLEDEIATYRKWGWRGWDDPARRAPARMPHDPDAFVPKIFCHDESESDSAELCLLMYLRTGERGWLDLGEAYARYFKTHACFRTDGFVYDGFRHVRSAVSSLSKRPCKGLRFGWYSPREYGWNDSRMCMCHTWGSGLFDYYCLTGDVDALEAGLDVAESAAITYPDAKNRPGTPLALGRAWGRQFKVVTRAYQLTREEKWKQAADYFAQRHLKAPNRHPSGLYANYRSSMLPYFERGVLKKMPPRLKQYVAARGITYKLHRGELIVSNRDGETWKVWNSPQSFEFAAACEAVARYAEVTGDPGMRKLVVDLARGARDLCWSKGCQHGLKAIFVGFPHRDKVYDLGEWDDEHRNCPGPDGGKHSGYHTRFYTDIFARAYSASGEAQWLELAKRAWNRGSKRGYWTRSQSHPDDMVAAFASHKPPKGDGIDIRNCMRLSYEVPRAK